MTSPPRPSSFIAHWSLTSDVAFLNHGSFGATPRAVQEEQSRWRERLEREPVSFFVEHHEGVMDATRDALAAFLGCSWRDLALLPNATIAANTVMNNLALSPGDELLMSEQEYPACQNTVRHYASRSGAGVVYAPVPFPIASADEVVEAYLSRVTPRTRLALISHVTSPTGLVMPVERLVPELARRGVRTFVDGAHAPGMIPSLNLGTLGADYYTANCHKWVCSPKGSAFLYVREGLQEGFRPLAISNNAEKTRPGRSRFLVEFDYQGTQDYTALYAIPSAIREMARIGGSWRGVMDHNRAMCVRARGMLCEAWGVRAPAPESMIGSIATIVLPPHDEDRRERLMRRPTKYHDALQDALLTKWRIQVPVWGLAGKSGRFLRISSQLYNSWEQYEYLAEAVREELAAERAF